MKETIYLVCSREKVERMRKTLPHCGINELPIKVRIEIPDDVFAPLPIIEKHIFVPSWEHGIDLEDVDFEGNAITKEEAEAIREGRLRKMKRILEEQGYTVEKVEDEGRYD